MLLGWLVNARGCGGSEPVSRSVCMPVGWLGWLFWLVGRIRYFRLDGEPKGFIYWLVAMLIWLVVFVLLFVRVWLVGGLVGRVAIGFGRSVGWSVYMSVDQYVCRSVGLSVTSLTRRLIHYFRMLVNRQSVDRPVCRSVGGSVCTCVGWSVGRSVGRSVCPRSHG